MFLWFLENHQILSSVREVHRFLVENAAKHKKFMKKSKNIMRNDKKVKNR